MRGELMNSYIEFPHMGLRFNIDRVAFNLGNKPVYWYGIIIAAGLLLGIFAASRLAKRRNISTDTLFDIVLWALPSAVICARLYYVIFEFDQYRDNLLDVFKIWNGGIAIYGAVIGAVLSTYIYCRAKKLDFPEIADVCCVGLVVGQMIGRWGNFTNQEAFGGNTSLPWGMTGSDIVKKLEHMQESGMAVSPDLPVHPTFWYESLWNLCVLGILLFVLTYITFYGLGRLWIEGLRTDSLYLGAFRVSQLVALACVIGGAVMLIRGFKKTKNITDEPEDEKIFADE